MSPEQEAARMSPAPFDLVDANEQTGVFYIADSIEVLGPFLFVRCARYGCVAVRAADRPYTRSAERLYPKKIKCYKEWADAAEAVARDWDKRAALAFDKAAALRSAAKAARSAR